MYHAVYSARWPWVLNKFSSAAVSAAVRPPCTIIEYRTAAQICEMALSGFYYTLVGLISKSPFKLILHDDLHGLITVGSGQLTIQSSN